METIDHLTDETAAGLRELAVALRDSQIGLTEAASRVSDKEVVKLFYGISSERATMEQQLNDFLRINGEPVSEKTSWLGELTNAWTKIRAAVNGGDAHVILTEVERSEGMIAARYKRVLAQIAGNPINNLLLEQYEKVKDGCDAVRTLRIMRNQ